MSDHTAPRITSLGDGRVVVEADGVRTIAYAVADGARSWVFVNGRTFVIETAERATRGGSRRRDDETALSSPMPAMVVAVNVTAGQDVAEGDVLVMLEAMKMELPIRAPRTARVKAVNCHPGELVQPGVPLLDLE